jgi:simple sugar transport system permease protein
MQPIEVPGLSRIPLLGPVLFTQNALVYLSLMAFGVSHWFLYRTKAGLILRAVGESPESAHAVGYRVVRIRYAATLLGGALAGVAGAYLAVAYTPMWVEHMAAGRGWIALALVVFATWRPVRVLAGAYLFGGMTILQLHAQALGLAVPSQLLSALPYLATIGVLVVISRDVQTIRGNAPASLGKPFHPGD